MERGDLESLVEELVDNIDDLEEALTAITTITLSDLATRLPLLDQSKFYIVATYAIESVLFCWSSVDSHNA